MRPTKKVATAGLAGAVSVLVVMVLTELGVQVSAQQASSITVVVTFLAGWLKSD